MWHSRFSYVNFDTVWIGTGDIDFGLFHNARTNMVDNFRIKTILVSIESWDLELSNGTRVVFARSLSKRFVDTN